MSTNGITGINPKNPKLTNPDAHVLNFSHNNLQNFLYAIIDTKNNIITLDKYLIKIICLYYLYGCNRQDLETLWSVNNKFFRKLLFVDDEYYIKPIPTSKNIENLQSITYADKFANNDTDLAEAMSIFLKYLFEIISKIIQQKKLQLQNNIINNSNSDYYKITKIITHTTDGKTNKTFNYKFLDDIQTSTSKAKRKSKIELQQILIHTYFKVNKNLFKILTGSIGINDYEESETKGATIYTDFDALERLILLTFNEDSKFNKDAIDNTHRFISLQPHLQQRRHSLKKRNSRVSRNSRKHGSVSFTQNGLPLANNARNSSVILA